MAYFCELDYLIELKIVLYFLCDPGYDEASLALRRSQT